MRVISGTARGRKLHDTSGTEVRPTGDMVKEAIFDIIQFDIEGRRVLDLYAGTGQLGIEAMSRGAKSVDFVDSNPQAVKLIRKNLKLCGFSQGAYVHTRDVHKHLEGIDTYDVILADPPYDAPYAGKTIVRINEFDKLNVNGIIIYETSADNAAPSVSPPYFLLKEYKYGRVKIIRYGKR